MAGDVFQERNAPAAPVDTDDRVLVTTRALALFIAPFLLVAFVILYGFPGETRRLWSWTIQAHLTSMVLASAYLGGCFFFLRVLRERRWTAMQAGFVAVALFATLLGIATVVHWDRFNHGSVAFWLWAGLYFTAPFLVVAAWLANHAHASAAAPAEPRLGIRTRAVLALTGGWALLTGIVLFLLPTWAQTWWAWPLTPLTSRVVGATFCLGSASLVVLRDPRWVAVRLLVQTQVVMAGLILVAAVRARGELFTGRPVTWLLGAGLVVLFVGGTGLLLRPPREA
jgi:hypothetical protein